MESDAYVYIRLQYISNMCWKYVKSLQLIGSVVFERSCTPISKKDIISKKENTFNVLSTTFPNNRHFFLNISLYLYIISMPSWKAICCAIFPIIIPKDSLSSRESKVKRPVNVSSRTVNAKIVRRHYNRCKCKLYSNCFFDKKEKRRKGRETKWLWGRYCHIY